MCILKVQCLQAQLTKMLVASMVAGERTSTRSAEAVTLFRAAVTAGMLDALPQQARVAAKCLWCKSKRPCSQLSSETWLAQRNKQDALMQELRDCIWELLDNTAHLPSLAAEGLLDCIDLRGKAAQALQQQFKQTQPSQDTSFGRKAVQVGLCTLKHRAHISSQAGRSSWTLLRCRTATALRQSAMLALSAQPCDPGQQTISGPAGAQAGS